MKHRFAGFFLLALPCAVLAAESGLDIQDPPGMRSIVTRENGVTHIRFVAKTAGKTAGATAAPQRAAAKTSETAAGGAPAAASSRSTPKELLGGLNLDLPISAIPAFVALDLSPETVSHPASPRDFAAALLNGVDRQGVLQTGVALETAPFRLLDFVRTDIRSYGKESWDGYWNRLLYNFSLSLATAKASEKSDALQLALGFNAILYQDKQSDPRRNTALKTAFHEVNLAHPVRGVPIGTPADQIADENPVAKQTLQNAVDAFREKSWAGTTWAAAAAPTWTSESGKASNLKSTGFSAWTTFSHGLQQPIFGASTRLQFLGQIRYRQGERVAASDDKTRTATQDTLIAAGRVRLGGTDFNGFAEGGYVRVWHGLEGSGSGWRAAGGLEKRLAKNLWLVLSVGEQFGAASSKSDELFAVGSLRIGAAETPQMAPSE